MSCAVTGWRCELSTYSMAAAENEKQNIGLVKDFCRGAPIFYICTVHPSSFVPFLPSSSSPTGFFFLSNVGGATTYWTSSLRCLWPSGRRKQVIVLFPVVYPYGCCNKYVCKQKSFICTLKYWRCLQREEALQCGSVLLCLSKRQRLWPGHVHAHALMMQLLSGFLHLCWDVR